MAERRLIVGLGNPGAQYATTRHNAGAWFVEALATAYQGTLKTDKALFGQVGCLNLAEGSCHLLIPNTYMNLSGRAVLACAQFYKIPPEHIIVAHDELDFAVGTIRFKTDGGHGGHNGLRDIIQTLSTRAFHRLRIGIDHPGHPTAVTAYVLGTPSKPDRQHIDDAIAAGVALLPRLMAGEYQAVMQALHTINQKE